MTDGCSVVEMLNVEFTIWVIMVQVILPFYLF